MSFSINKLVQPECGSSNPLVTAAQQIAMKPSIRFNSLQHNQAPLLQANNLVKEFVQQNSKLMDPKLSSTFSNMTGHQQASSSKQTNLAHNSWSSQINTTANVSWTQNPYQQWNNMITSNQQIPQPASAGDQLEIKYRNDIISQSNNLSKEKDDDLQFWQALSQKYAGPTTSDNTSTNKDLFDATSTTKSLSDLLIGDDEQDDLKPLTRQQINNLPAELDYHFDERNPLKDQFEDPFTEGLKRLEQGDIPSAALLFEAAVQNDPDNAIAWRYLGTTQAQNEKDSCAIRALRNCLKHDNTDQLARLAIAVSLANETYHYEACKHLLDWLMNHDKYKMIGASLEEFHLFDNELSNDPFYVNSVHEKHYRYVRDKFVEAARISPNNPDPEVQSALGVLFNMRGEYDKAVDCFKAALSVKANDSLLWNRLGATLANGNKSDEAVVAYRKALEISPGFLRSRYNLAISLIHLNTYDEAAKQLVQILNMQAAGKGSKNTQIRTRSITSSAIWNTLRTVATLMNKPELYPMIEGRDLERCNLEILKSSSN